ncbi:MAG TPA: response regulator [Salinivirgaceae bacterium]|nr:response regulator [Salinivirgaceae bacterium]
METIPKILVVDDSENNLFLLEEVLQEYNYTVIKARNGKEALVQIKNHRPDLILLDIMMSELSGYDVLEELKKNQETIPVIVISARSSAEDVEKAFALGAKLFIKKPVIITHILAKIDEVLMLNRN